MNPNVSLSFTAAFFAAVYDSGTEFLKEAFKTGYNFEVDSNENLYFYCPNTGDDARDDAVEQEVLLIAEKLFPNFFTVDVFYDGITYEESLKMSKGGEQ